MVLEHGGVIQRAVVIQRHQRILDARASAAGAARQIVAGAAGCRRS